MENSLRHIREELHACIATSTALLSAIERVQMNSSRLLHRCAYPVTAACAQAVALIRYESVIHSVVEDLSFLRDTFDNEIDRDAPSRSGSSSILVLIPTIEVHEAALKALLLFAQNARQTAVVAMKAGHL